MFPVLRASPAATGLPCSAPSRHRSLPAMLPLRRVTLQLSSLALEACCITSNRSPADTSPRSLHSRSSSVACSSSCSQAATGEQQSLSSSGGDQAEEQQQEHWLVLNFYHLVDIPDPSEMVARHRTFLSSTDIRGRVWISGQGINTQAGGLAEEVQAYADWVAAQPEFQGLRYTLWPATGHTFPRLRLKLKPNLISLAGGMDGVPVTDPAARATPLEPAAWKQMLEEDNLDLRPIVLDVRNDYEWDAGHFEGAARPEEEVFAETPVGEQPVDVPSPLRGVDPDTPVMMYCTGGIRCDVYSAFLKQQGFKNVYTLEGGVQNYLRQAGQEHWKGSLFVFDGRMAINPALEQDDSSSSGPLPAAVPCQLCGEAQAKLPHMNCANVDCNELFIACEACKTRFHGCCCESCQAAPRLLRPLKIDGGNYGSWGNYVNPEVISTLRSPRQKEGRLARRARRRELMKARREKLLAEKKAMKAAVKAAMVKLEEAMHGTPEQKEPELRRKETCGAA